MSDIQIPLLCKYMSGGKTCVYCWINCYLKTENPYEWTGRAPCASGFTSRAPALFPLHGRTSHTVYKEIEVGTCSTNFYQNPDCGMANPLPCKKTFSSLQEKPPCQTMSLVASFAARTFVGSWVADILMSLERVCSSWLFWDAVCPHCKRL